jgi:heme exporter protein D
MFARKAGYVVTALGAGFAAMILIFSPDLGKYAGAVLSAYVISITLIVGLVLASLVRAARVRAGLDEVEARRKTDV